MGLTFKEIVLILEIQKILIYITFLKISFQFFLMILILNYGINHLKNLMF